jgi:hypothetical protein
MNDNPRTQEMYFLISMFLFGVAVIFETCFLVYIIRHPPNDPPLLGESSVGVATSQAIGLPQ